MTYYFLPLSSEDSKSVYKYGYGYIKENETKLIKNDALSEIVTYDKGTTLLIYNDVVYTIFKDYLDLSNTRRIYIGKESVFGCDIVKESV